MTVKATDELSAAVAKDPTRRVSLADIEAMIAIRYDLRGDHIRDQNHPTEVRLHSKLKDDSLSILSICILVLESGFVVIGKSAPMDRVNYNAELGAKFAYDDAVRQIWPLMAFHRKMEDMNAALD